MAPGAHTGCPRREDSRCAVGIVSYKGVRIDYDFADQPKTVSFRVFTPPGWMQWQATQ